MHIGISLFDLIPGQSGGTGVYSIDLIRALARQGDGCRYTLLVRPDNIEFLYKELGAEFSFVICHFPAPRPLPFKAARWMIRRILLRPSFDRQIACQIEKLGLDLVHYPATIIYPLSLKIPCILTFWDMQHEYFPQFFPKALIRERDLYFRPSAEKAKSLIAPSQYTLNSLVQRYSISADKINLIPAAPAPIFREKLDTTEMLRIKAKYSLPEKFLFYPANPWPHKNHINLIKAFRLLKCDFKIPHKLVLTGTLTGQHNINVSEEVAQFPEIVGEVIELGHVPFIDLPGLYATAELLVFPSLFEGFGIPVLEAMACGCPVVCSNTTSLPELVDGAAGLFDPQNPVKIAWAILEVLNDKILRSDLITRGLARAGNYNWEKTAELTSRLYQKAIELT